MKWFGAGCVLIPAASSRNHYRGVKRAAMHTPPYMATARVVPAASGDISQIIKDSREKRAGGGG